MDTYYKLFPDLVEKIHLDLGIFCLPETRSYYNLCGIGSQHSNISYKNHWYARLQSR